MLTANGTDFNNEYRYYGDDYAYRVPERKKTLLETCSHIMPDGTRRDPEEIAFLCWYGRQMPKQESRSYLLGDMKHPPIDAEFRRRFASRCA